MESRNLIGTAILYDDIDRSKKLYRPVAPVYTRVLDRITSVSQSVLRKSEGHMESVQSSACMIFILISNNK